MNQNRPFFSTNANIYDNSFRSPAPATLNGQNVILSQEQQRRIYDTLNTALAGNNVGLNTFSPGNVQVLRAQRQFFPGGVTFTFNQQQLQPLAARPLAAQPLAAQPLAAPPHLCCKCPVQNSVAFDKNDLHSGVNAFFPSALDNQIPISGTPQPCGLDYLNYQQQVSRNPFQLMFHNDHSTSCSDLLNHFTQVPASKGYPDFCNIIGALQQNQVCSDISQMSKNLPAFFPLPLSEFSSNAKKLVLTKKVAPCTHVIDFLEEKEKNEINKKCVSFLDGHSEYPAKIDKSSQTRNDCVCNAKKSTNKNEMTKKQQSHYHSADKESKQGKPEKKKKEKKQKKSNTTSSDSSVSSDSECSLDSNKPKRNRW